MSNAQSDSSNTAEELTRLRGLLTAEEEAAEAAYAQLGRTVYKNPAARSVFPKEFKIIEAALASVESTQAALAQAEEKARIAAEQTQIEEEARIAAEQAQIEEEARIAAEQAQIEEEARIAAEQAQIEEEARIAAEQAQIEEEARIAAEQAQIEEEARIAAEQAQIEEEARAAEQTKTFRAKNLRCPECGEPYEPDSRFCAECGAKLPVSKPLKRFCPECGAEVDGRFCGECGTRID